jgi:REP-associated tyrosine transposase
MPRRARRQEAGLTYHAYAHAIRDEVIYRDRFDRQEFLRLLEEAVRAFDWLCHAYCEMATHYHLLVTTPAPNIAAGMQSLNSRYAEYFNRRHHVCGHLFRGRYGAVPIESEIHFLTEFRYITRNPVRAGICTKADKWPWSSYRATLGLGDHPTFLTSERTLLLFSRHRDEARRQLRLFVNDRAEPAYEAA